MVLQLSDFSVTDNTQEKADFLLKTFQNQNYITTQKNIITPSELLSKIDTKIIGITGTNGKTTTAFIISHILSELGYNVGVQGTEGFFINGKKMENKSLTTPPILKTIEHLYKYNLDYLIMEVSSHAISQNRIEGLNFSCKLFTNISQDHLDYHKSFEEYKKVKESFLNDDTLKVINGDENIKFNPKNSILYSQDEFKIFNKPKLVGEFNKYNLLGAVKCVVSLLNLDISKVSEIGEKFQGVAGRMEEVAPNIIVDFAHTPDGIEKVLSAIKKKKIVVFGAGGDRDKSKRKIMGEIVDKYADKIIITNDNPRSENPLDIISDISKGITNHSYDIVLDREEAIKKAISYLKDGFVVMILGKGDEKFMEINGKKIAFQDKEVVKKIVNI